MTEADVFILSDTMFWAGLFLGLFFSFVSLLIFFLIPSHSSASENPPPVGHR